MLLCRWSSGDIDLKLYICGRVLKKRRAAAKNQHLPRNHNPGFMLRRRALLLTLRSALYVLFTGTHSNCEQQTTTSVIFSPYYMDLSKMTPVSVCFSQE